MLPDFFIFDIQILFRNIPLSVKKKRLQTMEFHDIIILSFVLFYYRFYLLLPILVILTVMGCLAHYETWFNLSFLVLSKVIAVVSNLADFSHDITICSINYPFKLFIMITAQNQFNNFVYTLYFLSFKYILNLFVCPQDNQ